MKTEPNDPMEGLVMGLIAVPYLLVVGLQILAVVAVLVGFVGALL